MAAVLTEKDSSTDIVSTSSNDPEDFLNDLSDEDLKKLVDETLRNNEVLATETKMFEKYLKRVEPHLSQSKHIAAPLLPQLQLDAHTLNKKRSRMRGTSVTDRLSKLNAEQKCDIAAREIEELRDEIDKSKEDAEKVVDNHKAVMEEADIALAEIKKAMYEYNRDIVQGAVNDRTKKVMAEKVQRYFEEKIRQRDTLVEKLRLKNAALRAQKRKLNLQLKQKEEMGEVLHEVDFNQLKIENNQYLEKIDERNQELLRLKLMAANTLQILNSYRKKLHTLTLESNRLKTEIGQRHEILSKITVENDQVHHEKKMAESVNTNLKKQLADYKVPEIMEYVAERSNLYDLQKTVKSWERKVEIAEMALKTNKKTWTKIQTGNHLQNQWTQPHLEMLRK
ncbi:Coiled-coil domain-containing protein 113 [Trichoplax sp. H2]|uniref:Cilia- and flagella-associated protein 263 n=1 Tax=Trichoplax adhaerens TaxID=10228 RepID=B3RVE1_TRIAD|nr:hypothetical protein TRIADDRAFT_24214 [Trichoplax adhaerens]EDV25978.1 hypothetical protein TRIADDRAFT_24214 [Trichoplax adhaerens]RDD46899.1 Coiled-coil domain-containing protein 113 [Trichoplax sp. H2]|eukprot:XP_002112011.1 hypothetical protein TRIADDRAFT_24214 [Trichoplax adhaerens]